MPRTSISAPSTRSPNASSGIGKRRAASATATSTGSSASSSRAELAADRLEPRELLVRRRGRRRRRRRSAARARRRRRAPRGGRAGAGACRCRSSSRTSRAICRQCSYAARGHRPAASVRRIAPRRRRALAAPAARREDVVAGARRSRPRSRGRRRRSRRPRAAPARAASRRAARPRRAAARALDLEREQPRSRAAGVRRAEVGRRDAEARRDPRPGGRSARAGSPRPTSCQCSTSWSAVQTRSESAIRSGRRGAEDVQHELADRVRREVAVRRASSSKVAYATCSWSRRFASISRRNGSRGMPHSRTVGCEPAQERVLRLAVEDAVEVVLERVEQREPVAGDLVADLVDEAREAVDRDQVIARPAPEEPQRDREVLVRRERQDGGLAGQRLGPDCGVIGRSCRTPAGPGKTVRAAGTILAGGCASSSTRCRRSPRSRRRRLARGPRARGGGRQPLRGVRGAARRAGPTSASSSSRTCAACTASTRSSRCASPSAGYAAVAIDYFGRTAGVGKRDDDFAYMEHVDADDAGGRPGRRRAPRSSTALAEGGSAARSSPSASASAAATRGSPRPAATASRARSASTAARRARTAARARRSAPPRSRRRSSRSRRATTRTSPPRTNAAFEEALTRRRRRARARHLRGRAAQLLRPQAGGVRRRVGGRLGARARLRRAAIRLAGGAAPSAAPPLAVRLTGRAPRCVERAVAERPGRVPAPRPRSTEACSSAERGPGSPLKKSCERSGRSPDGVPR